MTGPDTDHLRGRAWELLAPGFVRRSDVVTALRELAEDDEELGVSPDEAEAVVHELWARHEAQLATTPARRPTDDRRVADAFAALVADGLVAEMDSGFDAVPVGRDRFGSREEYDAAAAAVGHRIAQKMLEHGLDVRWDGQPTSRIQLVGLDWRRPLPSP